MSCVENRIVRRDVKALHRWLTSLHFGYACDFHQNCVRAQSKLNLTNTIDAGPPTSSVQALPPTSPAEFSVSWSGDDPNGSGIATYDVYVSEDGGPFVLWQAAVTATMATYTGIAEVSYGFYSVATDQVGYRQPTPAVAQASTKVEAQTDFFVYLPMVIK
jgi:hypothetical protein